MTQINTNYINLYNELLLNSDTDTASTLSVEEAVSIFSSNEDTSESSTDIEALYSGSEWESVSSEKETYWLFGTHETGYTTFSTSDGTTVKVKNEDVENVQILQNSKTGEIVVIGAKDAQIEGGKSDVNISVYNSTIDELNLNNGNDTVYIENSEVNKISGGKGDDKITLKNSTVFDEISGDKGDDTIEAYDSVINNIFGNQGEDTINIFNTQIMEELNGGNDNDNINISDNSYVKSVKGEKGTDSVYIDNSDVESINTGTGDDFVSITDSDVSKLNTSTNIFLGLFDSGDDTVVISSSDVDSLKTGHGNDSISTSDSSISNLKSGSGNDNITVSDNSQISTIKSGTGYDSVHVTDSSVDNLKTGIGDDFVSVYASDVNNLNTGSGDDTVMLNSADVDTLKTGRGDDSISASDSSITNLKSGSGSDSLSLNNTEVTDSDVKKKDLLVEDGNYFADLDISKLAEIDSDVEIELSDGSVVALTDYVYALASQDVGFDTDEEYYQYLIESMTSNLEAMKSTYETQNDNDGWIADIYSGIKELSSLGISSDDVEVMIEEQQAIIDGLTAALNGESDMSFEEAYIYYTGTTFSKDKIDSYLKAENIYSAVMIGCSYDEDFSDKFEDATGLSVSDISNEYVLCQLDIYGESSVLNDFVDKYSQDQENFADNLSSIISTVGIVCIVAGVAVSFVFPPAGAALLNLGRGISITGMLIDNGLDYMDDMTDADGLTLEEFGDCMLETGVEVVSFMAGQKIGQFTNSLNSLVSSKAASAGAGKIASYVLGQTAETAADTVLSLAADYGITQGQSLITTGDFMDWDDYWSVDRFTGEGRSQFIGILTGLASAKITTYNSSLSSASTAATTTALAATVSLDSSSSSVSKITYSDTDSIKTNTDSVSSKTTQNTDFKSSFDSDSTLKLTASDISKVVNSDFDTLKTSSDIDTSSTLKSTASNEVKTDSSIDKTSNTDIVKSAADTSSAKLLADSDTASAKVNADSTSKSVNSGTETVKAETIVADDEIIKIQQDIDKIINSGEKTTTANLDKLRETSIYQKILNGESIEPANYNYLEKYAESLELTEYEKLLFIKETSNYKITDFSTDKAVEEHHNCFALNKIRTSGTQNLSETDQKLINSIDEDFKSLTPTEEPMLVYRGITSSKGLNIGVFKRAREYYNLLVNAQEGDIITEAAYTYTAQDYKTAHYYGTADSLKDGLMIEIEVPSGAKVSEIMDSGRAEVLLNRNSQFEVIKKAYFDEENGQGYITLRYIIPEE